MFELCKKKFFSQFEKQVVQNRGWQLRVFYLIPVNNLFLRWRSKNSTSGFFTWLNGVSRQLRIFSALYPIANLEVDDLWFPAVILNGKCINTTSSVEGKSFYYVTNFMRLDCVAGCCSRYDICHSTSLRKENKDTWWQMIRAKKIYFEFVFQICLLWYA